MNKVHFFCRLFCHCDGENKKSAQGAQHRKSHIAIGKYGWWVM